MAGQDAKENHMRRFDRMILKYFTEYFDDFNGLTLALYNAIFVGGNVYAQVKV